MSNLSELLPAGSSVKSANFVAQGTLASGVTVALRSDGKVEAVSATGGGPSAGTPVVYEAANSFNFGAAFDSNSNKVVIAYGDQGNSGYGTAIVGTVSGSSISFGSPVVFESANTFYSVVTFDSNANKVAISYMDGGNSNYGTSIVGTVSGTSISFGSPAVFESATTYYIFSTFDSSNNKIVIAYQDAGNSAHGTAVVGTISGTSISFGTPVVYEAATVRFAAITFDSSNNKIVIGYRDDGNSSHGTAIVGTVSGTSISFGTPAVFLTQRADVFGAVFDSSANKVVIVFQDPNNSDAGTAVVATVSGTNISFGSLVTFGPAYDTKATFDSNANVVVVSYKNPASPYSGSFIIGTVSGTSISFGSATIFETGNTDFIETTFDSNANKVVTCYRDQGDSNYGKAVVLAAADTNASSFIGITDQAISSAATGKVVCKGGAITNTGLAAVAPVLGTPVSASSVANGYVASAFDSSNNKVVLAYNDGSAGNIGKAIVGTVSGNSISYGSEVTFESGSMSYTSIAFDSNANKVVIAYTDGGNSSYGTAIVGTVSGTSISFGTPVVFETANTDYIATTFDSNLNKIVIAYRDTGNSNYGTAIVGTVSGTSISFGTGVVYNSGNSEYVAATFDSNSNKVVVAYNDGTVGNLGKAIVGTVSGTSISFGSEATFNATQSNYVSAGFDSNSNKVVVLYSDVVGGSCIVGTVSGTSISFGTETRVGTSTSTSFTGMSFDPVNNKMILVYRAYINSAYLGNLAIGTVSGTSITVSDVTTFNATNTVYCMGVYDTNANRTVITYQTAALPYPAVAVVLNLSSDLTPNTAYFVQDDGTISTTSSTTKAGTALSTTSLLLTG